MESQLATNREREIFRELQKKWIENHLQDATSYQLQRITNEMYRHVPPQHQRAHGLNQEPVSVRN